MLSPKWPAEQLYKLQFASRLVNSDSCVSYQMECLRSVLTIAGRAVERDAPQRMAILVGRLREAFVQPGLSAQTRKTLLELLELHASGWQLNLAQQLYYFPYTSLEHRK
ncbi:hypothetical protein HPB51_016181 [Rhipicephalus microplus]|uniref:MIF4G domain-containing protein n=1 Tax=Rhipicephalus microplus TaxID=6941 RepID=A0A9J6E246_RHIMP|nr:hypothetical protein HPB51_016181 [Rhipicephalus microplus]